MTLSMTVITGKNAEDMWEGPDTGRHGHHALQPPRPSLVVSRAHLLALVLPARAWPSLGHLPVGFFPRGRRRVVEARARFGSQGSVGPTWKQPPLCLCALERLGLARSGNTCQTSAAQSLAERSASFMPPRETSVVLLLPSE